jgi:tetratricopeptide (TPR) repeat protein
MDIIKVTHQHKKLCNLISEKKVKQGLDVLADIIKATASGEMQDDYDNLVLTYRTMLNYTIDGIYDPERDKVYLKLVQSILRLADRAKQDILSHYSGWHTYWIKQQFQKEQKLGGKNIVDTVDDLLFKTELDEWLGFVQETTGELNVARPNKHKHLMKNIFNHLWLTDYYGEAERSLVDLLLHSGKFRWYEACLFTTAVTLSTLRTWQAEKLLYLMDIYKAGQEQVTERALSGLVLIMHYYNSRMMLYPEVTERLRKMGQDERFREHCRLVVLQTIRSRETEKLSRKLQEEILPQVARLKPRIEEKLDLENILPMKDEKNPDWSFFNESEEIFKSMEELTKLQMEGADVYMSAFSNLKHFDFFRDFQNWFMPFYPENEAVDEIFKDEILGPGTNDLAEALYKTPFICNSDKYSLMLNLKYLPAAQKTMMLKVFRMELEGLQQMSEEEAFNDPLRKFRINVTQYLQDIYRFFKLSPYKMEFEDLFTGKMDIYNSVFFKMTFETSETEAVLADYFFSKNFYDDALPLFLKLMKEKPSDVQLYEKAGFCFQENGNFEEALKYYKMADVIERKIWTIKKIGLCLRRLGRNREALEYYLQAGELEPENIHTVIMTAHCYLDLKEYDEALKYYFKVEYQEPGNLKILRPIAYCYLALGRYDDSEKYLEKLSAGKLTAHDLINKGHLEFCRGNRKEAVEYYKKSIVRGELSKDEFMNIFNEDKPLLLSLGIDPDDFPIILDYLLFSIG